jgi:hypothetical protein
VDDFLEFKLPTYEALHCPAKGLIDKELEAWLHRASFWIGTRDHCP